MERCNNAAKGQRWGADAGRSPLDPQRPVGDVLWWRRGLLQWSAWCEWVFDTLKRGHFFAHLLLICGTKDFI